MLATSLFGALAAPTGNQLLPGADIVIGDSKFVTPPSLRPDVSFFDDAPIKSVAANGFPSDLTTCMASMKGSAAAYKKAARELGVEKEVAFDAHEHVTLHRQALARHLRKQTAAKATSDMVYFVVPRAEVSGSLPVNRLLTTGQFVGGDVMWDKTHPAQGASTMALSSLGGKSVNAAAEIDKAKAYQWTVVRNPLDHFMSGVHHVERILGKSKKAYELVEAGAHNGSQWMVSYAGDQAPIDRAHGMLADYLASRGPKDYLEMLDSYLTPQTLGFSRADAQSGSPGAGFLKLDYIGHMENLDKVWSDVQQGLGVTEVPLTDPKMAEEMTQLWGLGKGTMHKRSTKKKRTAKEEDNLTAEEAAVLAKEKLIEWQETKAAEEHQATLKELKAISDVVESTAPSSFAKALCYIFEREHACLGYTLPKHCVWQGSSSS